MDILERIKTLRDERNWTNYRLCDEAGLPYVTVTNMFSRGTQPTISTLKALCDAFDISLAQFFSEGSADITLNGDELQLISNYRKLSKKDRAAVAALINSLAD